MENFRIPKVFGWAFLSMVILVLISILVVAIYAYGINPGHESAFYDDYAKVSAPWVAGIGGFILFYLIVKYWAKKGYTNLLQLAILLPTAYVLLDIVILMLEGSVVWSEFYLTFLLANGLKFLGSWFAYYTS